MISWTKRHTIKLLLVFLSSILLLQAESGVSEQVWGNLTLGTLHNDKVYVELDMEPKVQITGETEWRNIDATPLVEYYPDKWIDLTAEVVLGYTKDSESIKTYEISPRLGLRLHIFGNLRQFIPNDNIFYFERFNLSTLLRYEYRSLYYNDKSEEHQSRLRLRIETKTSLNHKSYSQDNTYYIFADAEEYFNFGKEVKEVFSNKSRIRVGPGYNYNVKHRFELLMIYDYARDTYEDNARHDAVAVDFRYKIFYWSSSSHPC